MIFLVSPLVCLSKDWYGMYFHILLFLKHELWQFSFSHSSTMLLNRTTAIVRVYMPVRKSNYWPTGRLATTIGGAVPVSTSGNRATSGWFLYVTSNNKLCLGIWQRWRTKSKNENSSLYISCMVYMIITQTRCTMVLLLAVISEESRRHLSISTAILLLPAHSSGKKLAQNAKSDPIRWNVYMQE